MSGLMLMNDGDNVFWSGLVKFLWRSESGDYCHRVRGLMELLGAACQAVCFRGVLEGLSGARYGMF